MAMKFIVQDDAGGHPTWWLYGSNGEMTAWAGESFSSTYNALRASNAFKVGALTARYEEYVDIGYKWRWRAWHGSDKVAASGESFADQPSARRAWQNVRDNAGHADGPGN